MNSFINTNFNFFPFIQDVYKLCKNIELYKIEEHPLYQNDDNEWPGHRSLELSESEPFLYLSILEQAKNKLGLRTELYRDIKSFVHVRGNEDDSKDWIHKDQCDTILVYLSESNLESGTTFYTNQEEVLLDLAFFQNAAVFFDGRISHKSKLNYGDSIENSRMTLNIFCYKK